MTLVADDDVGPRLEQTLVEGGAIFLALAGVVGEDAEELVAHDHHAAARRPLPEQLGAVRVVLTAGHLEHLQQQQQLTAAGATFCQLQAKAGSQIFVSFFINTSFSSHSRWYT